MPVGNFVGMLSRLAGVCMPWLQAGDFVWAAVVCGQGLLPACWSAYLVVTPLAAVLDSVCVCVCLCVCVCVCARACWLLITERCWGELRH